MIKKCLPALVILFFIGNFLFAQSPLDIVIDHLKQSEAYSSKDIADYSVSDQYQTRHNGLTHIYLQQRFEGIEIQGANLNYNTREDGSVASFSGKFISDLENKVINSNPGITAHQALQKALTLLSIPNNGNFQIREEIGGKDKKVIFQKGDFALEDIPAHVVYLPMEDETIRLAWEIGIYEVTADNYWNLVLDATTGELLKQNNRVVHCEFEKRHTHDTRCETLALSGKSSPSSGLISLLNNASVVSDSYNVYAFPVESPNHGARSLQISPWDEAGDGGTLGWHDDGTNDYTVSKGNNVDAYEDNNNSNSPTGGDDARVDGGANLEFDFDLDLSQDPVTQQDPIITNLFYWNNIIHDVMYQYGFDEPAGNFQEDNLGRGGLGSDYVRAEAQDNIDGAGNNANFFTPSDGSNPRMQMYLWDPVEDDFLEVNAPDNVAGNYVMVLAAFGGDLDNPITNDVVEVDDGSNDPSEGCDPLVNGAELTGKIALIDRGDCQFGTKCLNAQNAGAIAVIMCNNVPGDPVTMAPGNDGDQVTIPAVMIRQDDCATIRAELDNGLNVTMVDTPSPELDSDLDNGVITHEYGHGISNRLTGGPSNVNCLSNAEQMGEGWSDYFALWMTTNSFDHHSGKRGMGTYLLGEPTNGDGIRPTAYTTDMSINGSTYGDITNTGEISQPHGIGYLWCTMIWDMTWALINAHGFEDDFYNSNSSAGNIVALQLVMDGLKGQPCSPGFVDGRDAIIDADEENNNGENYDILWNVFARRGLGWSADQGSSDSRNDGTEAFDLPPGVPLMTEDQLFDDAPLPVEMTNFQAVSNQDRQLIELYWSTASENNNQGFDLQRRDGLSGDFVTITWLEGHNSNSFSNYSFDDINVKSGVDYYYRLRQVDFVGQENFSEIVSAKLLGKQAEIQVFPNPTEGLSTVQLSENIQGKVDLKVLNTQGQIVDQLLFETNGNAALEINLSNKPEGVYFLEFSVKNQKIVKRIILRK